MAHRKMARLGLGLLMALVSAAPCDAVDEVSLSATSTTMLVPGVVERSGECYDLELTIMGPAPGGPRFTTLADDAFPLRDREFELTRVSSASGPGAATYDDVEATLTIPSLRYTDGSSTTRYRVVLTVIRRDPLRFKVGSATRSPWTFTDSEHAAKVADWLRSAPPADNATAHFGVIGVQTVTGLGNRAEKVLREKGPVAMYEDAEAVADAIAMMSRRLSAAGPVMQSGGITAFREVQNLPWGMIEPARGTYNFTLLDHLVGLYQAYSVDYVGVAMPFASWDLATRPPAAAVCNHFFTEDFPYLAAAGKMDRYVNLDAFVTMLEKAVERYDGDGIDDMTGLIRPVRYWQIQNEPEGEHCGQFRNDVKGFVELMRRSHAAVKAACPDCTVLNGGAGNFDRKYAGGSFWWDFGTLGGNAFVDIIAVHANDGKAGVTDVAPLEARLASAKQAMGSDKPIWITEFGVMVSNPNPRFTSLSEPDGAAWYTRFYTAGLNGGATRFFPDSIAFFQSQGNTVTRLLTFYTNKLLESKLRGFSASRKLAAGQYRFTVGESSVYVLWNGVPSELTGEVTSYDIYGNETRGDAANLSPSESRPLIVVK